MNLAEGRIIGAGECDALLETLTEKILETLAKPRLTPETVIAACEKLVTGLDTERYLAEMAALGIPRELGSQYIGEARKMFSGEALRFRMALELGENYGLPVVLEDGKVTRRIMPLGVLLHVAAGNADGLPAFSVLEGLLTGNINILKLPSSGDGASVGLLLELIRIEPRLAEYIYVFDYSSKDIIHMKRLADAADAVVVWGGTEAVAAFRAMLPPNIRLIEWGHKVSFAYVTGGALDRQLRGIAQNIAQTGQLLCSSCQGIFLDTDDICELNAFCARFLPILDEAMAAAPVTDIGLKAQTALTLYSAELETIFSGGRVFRGAECSLTALENRLLEPAIGFGNAWVKPLPRKDLLAALRPYKNYLQTAALACGAHEKAELTDILLKTGIVRVCPGERMSAVYSGAPHDGEYPLRRYVKIASAE